MMRIRILFSLAATTAMLGCQEPQVVEMPAESSTRAPVELFLPEGDAVAGREAFLELHCNACHYVDETMDPPVSTRPGPDLGPGLALQTPNDLASSIVTPSHFDSERRQEFLDEAISRMGDYRNVMTIQQLGDLMAFLQEL